MAAEPRPYVTVDEYFAIERESDVRHEYRDGVIVAMVGASLAHNQIQTNLVAGLKGPLRRNGCTVLGSDMRVKAGNQRAFCYPDLSVVCGKPELVPFRPDTLANPTLIVEILSPSTESHDRGRKFADYRRIPSLREYVLVAQDSPVVEHYVRQDDESWRWAAVEGLAEAITFPTVGATVSLADIYDGVEFVPDTPVATDEPIS